MAMKEKLQEILRTATSEISAATNAQELDAARVKFLGKKGELTSILRGMGAVPPEERPLVGQMVNDVRASLEASIAQQNDRMKKAALEEKLVRETVDVTMPGTPVTIGK